jgi:hypothetical protein
MHLDVFIYDISVLFKKNTADSRTWDYLIDESGRRGFSGTSSLRRWRTERYQFKITHLTVRDLVKKFAKFVETKGTF